MPVLQPSFIGCDTPGAGGGGVPSGLRTNVELLGTANGVNKVFSTPDNFIHDGVTNERLHRDGLRLTGGTVATPCDYVASESGGIGTGYDTITFVRAPFAEDNILIDYYISS